MVKGTSSKDIKVLCADCYCDSRFGLTSHHYQKRICNFIAEVSIFESAIVVHVILLGGLFTRRKEIEFVFTKDNLDD